MLISHYRQKLPPSTGGQQQPAAKKPKKHPFIFFRQDEEEEEDQEPEVDVSVVMYQYNGEKALQHMTDGTVREATSYKQGTDGFVVATFSNEGTWTTDLPNSYLKDGRLQSYAAPQPQSKSTKEAGEGFQNLDVKTEKLGQETEKSMMYLKKKGVADKKQIIQVTLNQCFGEERPASVIRRIAAEVEVLSKTIPEGTAVKDVDGELLKRMKELAKNIRDTDPNAGEAEEGATVD